MAATTIAPKESELRVRVLAPLLLPLPLLESVLLLELLCLDPIRPAGLAGGKPPRLSTAGPARVLASETVSFDEVKTTKAVPLKLGMRAVLFERGTKVVLRPEKNAAYTLLRECQHQESIS